MPVTKQAIKKVRQDKRKTLINLKVKQAYKKAVRDFVKKPTEAGLVSVFKALDKAAKGNVIHKNRASRLKSRLSKKLPKTAEKKPSPQKRPKGK
jgi:small subunit ribosomal protein S20